MLPPAVAGLRLEIGFESQGCESATLGWNWSTLSAFINANLIPLRGLTYKNQSGPEGYSRKLSPQAIS